MATVYYLTHPQVSIDPSIPVPRWGLSDIGEVRARAAAMARWTRGIGRIITSGETKAIETARIFAAPLRLKPEVRHDMHENDRSATGFLRPDEFELMADAFFAAPEESVRGWERAADAQTRIVAAANEELAEETGDRDVLLVGHGAVGTLLMTHLLRVAISRSLDQPAGGGNVFAFDLATRQHIHGWLRLEDMD